MSETAVRRMAGELSPPDIEVAELVPYTTNWYHHAHIQARARRVGWGLHQTPLSNWGGGV
jgi:hypothetical protein